MAKQAGADPGRIRHLKELLYAGYLRVAASRDDLGLLVDDVYGAAALEAETGSGRWIARSAEVAGAVPLELAGGADTSAWLRSWPADQVVKVIAYWQPSDPDSMVAAQLGGLMRLQQACWSTEHELLVELQAPPGQRYGRGDAALIMQRCYEAGISPEWWKLPPPPDSGAWAQVGAVVRAAAPVCRGFLLLGHTASPAEISSAFSAVGGEPTCVGLAIGRGVFASVAAEWLQGRATDREVVDTVEARFNALIADWDSATSARGPLTASRLDPATAIPGIAALAIDQPGSIAQLALVVARQRQVPVAYIPGLVMRRAADLYPGEAKTGATPTSSPTRPALAASRCYPAVTEGFIWAAHARLLLRRLTEHTYD